MKKRKNCVWGAVLACALVLSGIWPSGQVQGAENSGMEVHFLDVGQGLSVLVQSGGENLLYDGGDRSTSSFVVSYLKEQNVETIDCLISSHYDADHVSGLIGCLNTFPVKKVIGADYEHDSRLYESFLEAAGAQGLQVEHPEAGTVYPFGNGEITILAPSEPDPEESNHNSVAVKVTDRENSFVLTGDAEYRSEQEMIAFGIELSCDVLCLGHHGSASSTSWEFLQETVPEYAVISCGADNQYGHPDKDTMDKLLSMEIPVLRTDKQGTLVAYSDGEAITWNKEPCNDYTPGNSGDTGTMPEGEAVFSDFAEETYREKGGEEAAREQQVWVSATGSKYHSIPDCGTMNPAKARQLPVSQAEAQGLEPCRKCF